MSAFTVSDETINEIVTYCNDERMSTGRCPIGVLSNTDPEGAIALLAGQLREMNHNALVARYGDRAGHWEPAPVTTERPGKLQLFKSLQCYLYQCSEGDVPDSAFFKAIDELMQRIAFKLVEGIKGYDVAEWR